MIRVVGPKDPQEIQDKAINTTSRSRNWSRGLSPFFVGPIELYGGYVAKNLENAWQFSKVYPQHFDEENDQIKDSYFEWSESGWSDERAYRYPAGKGAKPLFSYWDGERLGYVDARKKIYAPLYAEAVEKTSAYKQLKELHELSDELYLWDFDSYDHHAMGMDWKDVMNYEKKKMGHGFVLAMMLEDKLEEAIS